MGNSDRTRIDTAAVLLVVLLLAIAWTQARPWYRAEGLIERESWLHLAEARHLPVVRETAIETIREPWSWVGQVGELHTLLVLLAATAVAVRAWWRTPRGRSRSRRMLPALYPALAAATAAALTVYTMAASFAALEEQGLWHPGAVGAGVGEALVILIWGLLLVSACAVLFAWVPPPAARAPRDDAAAASTP